MAQLNNQRRTKKSQKQKGGLEYKTISSSQHNELWNNARCLVNIFIATGP